MRHENLHGGSNLTSRFQDRPGSRALSDDRQRGSGDDEDDDDAREQAGDDAKSQDWQEDGAHQNAQEEACGWVAISSACDACVAGYLRRRPLERYEIGVAFEELPFPRGDGSVGLHPGPVRVNVFEGGWIDGLDEIIVGRECLV